MSHGVTEVAQVISEVVEDGREAAGKRSSLLILKREEEGDSGEFRLVSIA